MRLPILFPAVLLAAVAAGGERFPYQPPPPGTQFAQLPRTDLPDGWTYNEKNECVESRGGGALSVSFDVASPGRRYFWIRYKDVKRQVNHTGVGALVVAFRQDGKDLAKERLPRTMSPLCDRKGWRKYGVEELGLGWPVSVWQSVSVEVPAAGKVEARISVADKGAYSVHSWAVTDDETYEPRIYDFYPLWVRFRSLPGETRPFRPKLNLPISCHFSPKYQMTNAVPVGGDSGWFYLSRFAGLGYSTQCELMDDSKDPLQDRHAAIELSRTPDEKGVFFREELKGHGNAFRLQVMETPWHHPKDAPYTVRSSTTESARSLAETKALPPQAGRAPGRFRFKLGLALDARSRDAFVNEMNVSLLLGCTTQPRFWSSDTSKDPELDALRRRFLPFGSYPSPMPSGYYENGYDRCLCSVNREGIVRQAERVYAGKSEAGWSYWWDEPGGRPHKDCKVPCTKAYRAYLKEMGVTPKALGCRSWDQVFPVRTADVKRQAESNLAFAEAMKFSVSKIGAPEEDSAGGGLDLDEGGPGDGCDPKKAAERYYWSTRYYATNLRRFLGFATAEVEKRTRNVLGGACLSPDFVDEGDGLRQDIDWFDLYGRRGLNFAETEDWLGACRNEALCGYLVDFLRGCCRRQGQPIGVADVICDGRTPWSVTAKAFAEIGHGAREIDFYGYGPIYARRELAASDVPGMRAAIRAVTFPVGAVEATLLDGEKAASSVAQLYSLSSDIRAHADGKRGRDGADRSWTNLLLGHLGYDVDVIDEDGISEFLKGYRCLWCGETALRRDCVKPLVGWIREGGTLFLPEGALAQDEFGRPLGFEKALGDAGKGRVVRTGRAGTEYRAGVVRKDGVRTYPAAVREKYAALLDEANVPKSVASSVCGVEAHLFRGKGADALVVANWTRTPQDVTLTVSDRGYSAAKAFNSGSAEGRSADGSYAIRLTALPAGDCIELLRR